MNKEERAQRNLWRDETKRAVKQAKAEEPARTDDDRRAAGKQAFLEQRARELLGIGSLASGDERTTKQFWINKLIRGKTQAENPDAPRIAPRFQAWPVEGEIPDWLKQRFADEHWLWNALAVPVQHTISRIREQQRQVVAAVYKQAEAGGQDTESEQTRKKLAPKVRAALKTVDYSPLKAIENARSDVLKLAESIRNGKHPPLPPGWNDANLIFARKVAALPAWLQRTIEQRLNASRKARRTRREAGADEKWFHGYPKPDPEDRAGEGRLDVYFNGDNLDWQTGEEMRNGYVDISAPWNPPDHRGPRGGKYRSARQMRKVTIYEPGSGAERKKKAEKNRFSLNVLFHSVPSGARMKQYRLRAEKDAGGMLRWFFIPTFELLSATGAAPRTFAGVDLGWRASGHQDFKYVHFWSQAAENFRTYELTISPNRWSRRYNSRQSRLPSGEQFPIDMTPAGLRDFASRMGALQRDFKAKMGETLGNANLLPTNWDRIGRRGIRRMMTREKSQEFAALQPLRPEFEAWEKRDGELARIYRAAWDMVSKDLDRQRRSIAREILAAATDIGVEALDVKQMAEAENTGATNRERHIENVQDRNRQLTGPARFAAILASLAHKLGKRIHWIDPRYTTRACSACGHVNQVGIGEKFTCGGCGFCWNRDENAARNLARLARECSGDDANPVRCSRDGKSLPYHGIAPTGNATPGRSGGEKRAALASDPTGNSKQMVYEAAGCSGMKSPEQG